MRPLVVPYKSVLGLCGLCGLGLYSKGVGGAGPDLTQVRVPMASNEMATSVRGVALAGKLVFGWIFERA